jgi:UDP-GlcNAc:undecaprenyl-phosphate GlcNAc-1-phosphate transferase
MKEYGLTVLVAATVTYLLTPLVRKFAIWFGAWHEPRERDVHTEPVPEMGGLAIFCGVAAALLVASRMFPLSSVFAGTRVGSGLLLAGGVVVLMGVVDDRWGLGALTKLVGQIGAGAILVWSGAVVGWLPLPGGGTLALSPDQQTALTILLVALTINAVNFIDGLDGLATGIVGIGAAAFYIYYYTLAKRLGLSEQTDPALASAVLAGVCLGFLPHNFHPARIFLGDTGAMLLGLLLAYVPISSLASLDPNTLTTPAAYSGGTVNRFPEILPLLLPATILLIPYVDLLLAVVRRTRAGQSPWHADKKHLHHRLLDIGHSHRTSVLIMYLWAFLFAGTVVLLSIIRTKLPVLGVVTLAGFLVLLWLTMPRLRPWARHNGARPVPSAASPAPAAWPAGSGPANSGPASPVPASPVPASPAPASPVPASPAPANPGPARPGAGATSTGYDAPASYRPAESYDAPASYRPAESYDAPGRYDAPASYGAADPGPAAAAGLAGLSGRNGRSAAGWPGRPRREAGRPGGHLAGGQAGDDYPAGEHVGNGYLAGGHAAGDYPAGNGVPADAAYPGGYLTGPVAPGAAEPAWDAPAGPHPAAPVEPRWDAPPEAHWDAPAEAPWDAPAEPRETEPEDAGQPPEQGRPAWPGDHPETEEPLLPWRFG